MNISRRQFVIGSAAAMAAMTLGVSGCSQQSSSTQQNSSDGAKPDYGTILVGTNPGTGNIFGYIAMEKGFDKDAGYTTELTDFDNSTDALNALQAGKINVGVNYGTAAPLTFVSKGADFTIFGGYVSGGMPLYAQESFEYKGLESFVGKKIGTARMYTPDILFRGAMTKAGYDLSKDVTLVEFKKPSEVLAAVVSGEVDAGVGTNSTYTAAVTAGLKILCWTNDLDPSAVCCRQVANTSWINEDPARATAYLKSIMRAEEVLYNDPDYAVEVFAKYTKMDEDKARVQLLETNQELWADPKSDGVQDTWQTLKDLEYIDAGDIDVTEHINIDCYKTALDELCEEYPDDEYFTKTLTERYKEYNSKLLK